MKNETEKKTKPEYKSVRAEKDQPEKDELELEQLEQVSGGLKMAPARSLREL